MENVENVQPFECRFWRLLNFAVDDLTKTLILVTSLRSVDSCLRLPRDEAFTERNQVFDQSSRPRRGEQDMLLDERRAKLSGVQNKQKTPRRYVVR